jgi:hypothetical protein
MMRIIRNERLKLFYFLQFFICGEVKRQKIAKQRQQRLRLCNAIPLLLEETVNGGNGSGGTGSGSPDGTSPSKRGSIILGRAPGTKQTAIPYERYEIITNVFFYIHLAVVCVDILRKITLISDASPIFMKIGNMVYYNTVLITNMIIIFGAKSNCLFKIQQS